MRLQIVVDQLGRMSVAAIDLTGDAWHDYLHYIARAQQCEAARDSAGTNRALRSALSSLIAHFDGVVSGLHEHLIEKRSDFAPKRRKGRFCTLAQRVEDIRHHVTHCIGVGLPSLDLTLKPIRDVLMHPNIKKTIAAQASLESFQRSKSSI